MKKVSGLLSKIEVRSSRLLSSFPRFTIHDSPFTISLVFVLFLGLLVPFSAFGAQKLIVKDSTGTNTVFVVTDTGQVGIGTGTPVQDVDIVAPDNGLIQLSNVTTDSTLKTGRMVVRHYSNAQLPVYLFGAASTSTNNFVAFGGGSAVANAATQIDFYTALNTTTPTGISRITIKQNGNVGMGTVAPTGVLDVNDNRIRVEQSKTPASSGDTCNRGEIAWDANYVYVCVASNTWKRSALSSW